jgi:HK97 family phage major capsid protein
MNEELKAAMAARDEAIAKRLGGIESKLTEFGEKFDTIEEHQAIQASAVKTGFDGETRESREHKRLFTNWVRKPHDSSTKQALGDFQTNTKTLSIGSSADGGYAVPEELLRDVERFERKFSPVRDLVKVVRISSGDVRFLVDIGGATSGWVAESDSRTATNTPKLREVVPTGGEIYAYPSTTEWLLDDAMFDIGAWLTESVAEAFAVAEGTAVISGNGTSKPTGMLNTTPVLTTDDASPKRAAAAYQYILGGDNSPAGLDGDSLIDLLYSVNARYRSNGTWVMNSTAAANARKLKDTGTGAYIWQPGLTQGQPNLLLGYPVAIWEQMPDIAGGAFPVAFGDFRRAYLLADRTPMRITVDPYTTAGTIKFYVRRRVYGMPSNNDAVKFLKLL